MVGFPFGVNPALGNVDRNALGSLWPMVNGGGISMDGTVHNGFFILMWEKIDPSILS